ncbi:hypothetical protein EDC14_101832 [Hydrogenispora ethanolica]|jgi:hypothetical protein|uniref:Uncharacterized protein n=1 Tax=Hydrogenispora ethanolica TaxID=1082276 RepID=A0A4R1RFK1_HYDET|nr:hypothetical protein [Hydrogenispora ethanolica]TCL64734.1 hypothetical protein EDC14_101832 [Hydrogenispora ethanolica]
MSKQTQIEEIVNFVSKHPQTVASRRICREILGEALERFNTEFSQELEAKLHQSGDREIDSYYTLIR